MAEESGDLEHTVTTVETRRQYGMYCCGLLLSLLLIILIIVVILVLLLVEGEDAVIILPVLLVLLIAVAIATFIFVRWQHKKATRNRFRGAEVIKRRASQDQLQREPVRTSTRSSRSWAFWRKTSSTSSTQLPTPSAPPLSTNTSLNTGEKLTNRSFHNYQPVSTNADEV